MLPPIALEAGRLVVRNGGAWTLVALMAVAVLLPLPVARILSRDRHMALLRRLGVTSRTFRDSIWADVFTEQGDRFVVFELDDGRRLQGYPRYWSDDPADGFVYLSRPACLVRAGEATEAGAEVRETGQHGLLIHRDEIRWIEFQPAMPHDDEQARPVHGSGNEDRDDG